MGIAWSEPLYVAAIDVERNVIIVGEQHSVFAGGLQAETVNWIVAPDAETFAATCKIRYRHQPVACQMQLLAENSCAVTFDQAQKAVTPGQALVFYRGDEVLGGGRIVRAL